MAKDPAFLFYPGDYLRDTQTLSEKSQVAYDRIICEHIRNICITQSQLKFFTKRLNQEEIDELMYVIDEINGGFQIRWVAESIEKRREYSESRRKNRAGDGKHICSSYDEHMENENENENKKEKEIAIVNKNRKKEVGTVGQNSKGPDFIDQVLEIFSDEYKKLRGMNYVVTNLGKDRVAISKLVAETKKRTPGINTEEMLTGMRTYFRKCIAISDKWLFNNIAPSIIWSQFNKINTLLSNGKSRNNAQQIGSLDDYDWSIFDKKRPNGNL